MRLINEKCRASGRQKGILNGVRGVVRRPVFSRNDQVVGGCYKEVDQSFQFSEWAMPKQRWKNQMVLTSFLDFLKAVELDCIKHQQLLSDKPKRENIYFLHLKSQLILSAYVCRQLSAAANRVRLLGGQLVVILGQSQDESKRLKAFCRNVAELRDDGVALGMHYSSYVNNVSLPEFMLRALGYLLLDPFAIGMPVDQDSINYTDLMYAGEVVREIHNHLDVKLVATDIETAWQERVVKALPVHYMLGGYYGGYKELARVP
ncbi:hypothetical protein [Halopseudomonas pelagia]|uniref:hypothetical protein n=1 Tax=Halopseudomonas pelagia TaxID=553151 RepID=UPI0030DC25F0|tara:strand:- start:520 stop:1302 length:783 start_codon:yes stop_codon:yes gene_type:complete